jgi:predicted nucleotide-binding protein
VTVDQQNSIDSLNAKNVTFGRGSHAGDSSGGDEFDRRKEEQAGRPQNQADKSRQVFVIHGRDNEARDAVFDFLRTLGLRPMEWEHLVHETGAAAPSLADVVSRATTCAQAVVAVLTPDDVVALHPDLFEPDDTGAERAVSCQARPNVFLELGIALATHPTSTILLEIGATRRPADLAGLNYVRVNGSSAWCNKVAERLHTAGCPIDRGGTDWQRSDRFSRLAAHHRRPPDPKEV